MSTLPDYELIQIWALLIQELMQRKARFDYEDAGTIWLHVDSQPVFIRVHRVWHECNRRRDTAWLGPFADRLLEQTPQRIGWDVMAPQVLAVPFNGHFDVGRSAFKRITGKIRLLWAAPIEDECALLPATRAAVYKWGIAEDDLIRTALRNTQGLLERSRVYIQPFGNFRIGVFLAPTSLKASLVFAPGLRRAVEDELGWPIRFCIPCDDFVYLLREADHEIIPKVLPVVLTEYHQHAAPISTELLRRTDKGIELVHDLSNGLPSDLR